MMMAGPYAGTLSDLPTVRDEVTCSINAENPTGAKGFGCLKLVRWGRRARESRV